MINVNVCLEMKRAGAGTCYIYIYSFSRHFYPKQLTVHSGLYIFYVHVFPGNQTHNRCAANAMQCSITEPREHMVHVS